MELHTTQTTITLHERSVHQSKLTIDRCMTDCATYELNSDHRDGFVAEMTIAFVVKHFNGRTQQLHDKCRVVEVQAVMVNSRNAFCNQPSCAFTLYIMPRPQRAIS